MLGSIKVYKADNICTLFMENSGYNLALFGYNKYWLQNLEQYKKGKIEEWDSKRMVFVQKEKLDKSDWEEFKKLVKLHYDFDLT